MAPSNSSHRPFTIEVPDDVLTDLQDRLARTRWPDQIPGTGWDYGTDLAAVQDLCEHWRTGYDWRQVEAVLNGYDQFETDIDGVHLHYLHVRSPHEQAIPLVMTHGWPGSIVEFLDVIGPLTDPVAHGGSADDAFHLVVPSLPGYGFSGPTTKTGISIKKTAQLEAELMAQLGYERYGAQGGDWGAMATSQLAVVDPEHVLGIHQNMMVAIPNAEDMESMSEEEHKGFDDTVNFMANEVGYQGIQSTKPQTLGYGLNDSPAGLCAWILEKFQTWTDNDGDVYAAIDRDRILDNITLYWVTGTINSSTRMYYETNMLGAETLPQSYVETPTGVALFPGELYKPPRSAVERMYNLQQWTVMPRGGHFAAMEQPTLLVDDVRTFFSTLR